MRLQKHHRCYVGTRRLMVGVRTSVPSRTKSSHGEPTGFLRAMRSPGFMFQVANNSSQQRFLIITQNGESLGEVWEE